MLGNKIHIFCQVYDSTATLIEIRSDCRECLKTLGTNGCINIIFIYNTMNTGLLYQNTLSGYKNVTDSADCC